MTYTVDDTERGGALCVRGSPATVLSPLPAHAVYRSN